MFLGSNEFFMRNGKNTHACAGLYQLECNANTKRLKYIEGINDDPFATHIHS